MAVDLFLVTNLFSIAANLHNTFFVQINEFAAVAMVI